MTGRNGQVSPGPGAKIIPIQPGIARPTGERRALMRDAVIQVVHHLVLESVPPGERSVLFDQAADLLDLAGGGADRDAQPHGRNREDDQNHRQTFAMHRNAGSFP